MSSTTNPIALRSDASAPIAAPIPRRPAPGLVAVLAAVASVAALAGPGARPAAAQLFSPPYRSAYSSPRHFALELRMGPYSPNVDGEFTGTQGPHDQFFGDGLRVMTQLELDWQFFQGFGSAALGVSVGFFRENAKAYVEPAAGQPVDVTQRSADNSRLSLFPFAVLLVYRADQLWQYLGVPLVPYGKVGLNYTIWSIYDGNGQVSEAMGGRARGGTRGWQAAAGVALVLDFIDRGSARELDSETGINHSAVFVEATKVEATGLGQKNRLHVGDTTWMAGLLFEF